MMKSLQSVSFAIKKIDAKFLEVKSNMMANYKYNLKKLYGREQEWQTRTSLLRHKFRFLLRPKTVIGVPSTGEQMKGFFI